MINKSNITGIILSGGKSSRMGTDKGFLKLKGKTFMEHSIEALKPFVSETIIISNNRAYDVFNLKRIDDEIEDAGPLAGVYTGLKHSKTDYNLVLSCDIPLINAEIIKLLIDAIDGTSEVIQIEHNHKSSPLIALYKKNCANKFYELLNEGERRLRFAVNQCKVKQIKLNSEIGVYTVNINTPEDYNKLQNDY